MSQPVRALVVHDSEGRIHSMVVSDPDAPLLTPGLRPGEHSSLVEGLEVALDSTDVELHAQLSSIAQDFTVQRSEGHRREAPAVAALKPK